MPLVAHQTGIGAYRGVIDKCVLPHGGGSRRPASAKRRFQAVRNFGNRNLAGHSNEGILAILEHLSGGAPIVSQVRVLRALWVVVRHLRIEHANDLLLRCAARDRIEQPQISEPIFWLPVKAFAAAAIAYGQET